MTFPSPQKYHISLSKAQNKAKAWWRTWTSFSDRMSSMCAGLDMYAVEIQPQEHNKERVTTWRNGGDGRGRGGKITFPSHCSGLSFKTQTAPGNPASPASIQHATALTLQSSPQSHDAYYIQQTCSGERRWACPAYYYSASHPRVKQLPRTSQYSPAAPISTQTTAATADS